MSYRLSQQKKEAISRNLVDFMESDKELSRDAATFIGNWILTDVKEKPKAFFDVWDLVLENYLPTTHPMLYRSCKRREDGKIRSFTGQIYCAHRFSEDQGFLLICNTEDTLRFPELQKRGEYQHTFFPISELLKKESQLPNCKFSKRLIDDYVKEDEYIMRVNLGWMYSCKWYQERGKQDEA